MFPCAVFREVDAVTAAHSSTLLLAPGIQLFYKSAFYVQWEPLDLEFLNFWMYCKSNQNQNYLLFQTLVITVHIIIVTFILLSRWGLLGAS